MHTSLILAFKKGFLMYQVDVKKVRANTSNSSFPDKSRLSGEWLKNSSINDVLRVSEEQRTE